MDKKKAFEIADLATSLLAGISRDYPDDNLRVAVSVRFDFYGQRAGYDVEASVWWDRERNMPLRTTIDTVQGVYAAVATLVEKLNNG